MLHIAINEAIVITITILIALVKISNKLKFSLFIIATKHNQIKTKLEIFRQFH